MNETEKKIKGEYCLYCDWASTCRNPCKDAKQSKKEKLRAQQKQELHKILSNL